MIETPIELTFTPSWSSFDAKVHATLKIMTLFIWHNLTPAKREYSSNCVRVSSVCNEKLPNAFVVFHSFHLFVRLALSLAYTTNALFDYVNNTCCLWCYDNQASSQSFVFAFRRILLAWIEKDYSVNDSKSIEVLNVGPRLRRGVISWVVKIMRLKRQQVVAPHLRQEIL